VYRHEKTFLIKEGKGMKIMLTYKGAVMVHVHDAGSASATMMSSRMLRFLTIRTEFVILESTSTDDFDLAPFDARQRPCRNEGGEHEVEDCVERKEGRDG